MSRATEADQGQPSTRRHGTATDQHGRKWAGSFEKRSGFPISVRPLGWRAPWIPPYGPETFKFDRDDPSKLVINYEGLLEQRLQDLKQYDEERQKAALVRGWDPTDPEKQEALDALVGPRDKYQSAEVVVACMQGDKWILGLTDKVNPKLERFIPKKVDRKAALLSKFPDFTVPDEDTAERYMDIEEQHDPEATPKGRVPVKPTKKPKAKAAPVTEAV